MDSRKDVELEIMRKFICRRIKFTFKSNSGSDNVTNSEGEGDDNIVSSEKEYPQDWYGGTPTTTHPHICQPTQSFLCKSNAQLFFTSK